MTNIYGFSGADVERLRRLLAAYEQGRIRIDAPRHFIDLHQADGFHGELTATVVAGEIGSAYLDNLDTSNPPVVTKETALATPPVYLPDAGKGLFVREPSQGLFIPAGSRQFLSAIVSSGVSITSTVSDITGLSLTLPVNSIWLLLAQLNGSVSTSSTESGVYIGCAFSSSAGTLLGVGAKFCTVPCSSISAYESATLIGITEIGSAAATLAVTGQLVGASTSTGSVDGNLFAVQLQP